MKKLILLLPVLIGLFTSCEFEFDPRADIDASKTTVYTYEEIQFYNYSNANDFEWDFGDGYVSNYVEPSHYYTRPGIYTVRLAAYHRDMVDYAYMTIKVVEAPSATLDVQVLEYSQEYAVEGARIILYPTYTDWYNQAHPVIEVFTNSNGIAVIDGLAPGYYYLDVWEANHDNYTLASEDINFIKTPYLVNYQTTYFTAYVDYKQKKSSSTTRRDTILKTNTQRVYSDKLNIRK